jgi:hypothetical protein
MRNALQGFVEGEKIREYIDFPCLRRLILRDGTRGKPDRGPCNNRYDKNNQDYPRGRPVSYLKLSHETRTVKTQSGLVLMECVHNVNISCSQWNCLLRFRLVAKALKGGLSIPIRLERRSSCQTRRYSKNPRVGRGGPRP